MGNDVKKFAEDIIEHLKSERMKMRRSLKDGCYGYLMEEIVTSQAIILSDIIDYINNKLKDIDTNE